MGAPFALAIAKIPCTVDNGSFLSLFLQCSVVHQTYKHTCSSTSHFSIALFFRTFCCMPRCNIISHYIAFAQWNITDPHERRGLRDPLCTIMTSQGTLWHTMATLTNNQCPLSSQSSWRIYINTDVLEYRFIKIHYRHHAEKNTTYS